MLYRRLALLLALALLSANLLSVDFDGGAFEGKGIETTVLYLPSSARTAPGNGQRENAARARYVAPGEEQSVAAFEVSFILISKYVAPSLHITLTLPAIPDLHAHHVQSVPLVCLSMPRSPPAPADRPTIFFPSRPTPAAYAFSLTLHK